MAQTQFTFDWDFSKLETTANVGNYTDVVTRIYWTLIGSDSLGNTAPLTGSTEVDVSIFRNPVVDGWVEYTYLTKEHVEEILENTLGEDEIARMTDNLTIQLQQLEATQVTDRVPPWVG